jgi:hypothetical protein
MEIRPLVLPPFSFCNNGWIRPNASDFYPTKLKNDKLEIFHKSFRDGNLELTMQSNHDILRAPAEFRNRLLRVRGMPFLVLAIGRVRTHSSISSHYPQHSARAKQISREFKNAVARRIA